MRRGCSGMALLLSASFLVLVLQMHLIGYLPLWRSVTHAASSDRFDTLLCLTDLFQTYDLPISSCTEKLSLSTRLPKSLTSLLHRGMFRM